MYLLVLIIYDNSFNNIITIFSRNISALFSQFFGVVFDGNTLKNTIYY